jgi:hypothetical protein
MDLGTSYFATVEDLVARRLGGYVRHLGSESVPSARANRTYLKHRLKTLQGRELLAFSKGGEAFRVNEPLELFLADVASADFAVPKFFGCAESGGLKIAVWAYVSGQRAKRFHQLGRAEMFRVVRAVGAMNALTDEANRRVPGIRLPDVDILGADTLKRALEEFDEAESTALIPAVESYERAADRTRRRLREIDVRYFSHQDIVARNVLFAAPDLPPVFIDWENTSLAVPGTCLRNFCLLDFALQKELVAHYVAFMAAKGHILNARDILFVMGASQIQLSLRQGLKRRKIKFLRWALGAVKTYLHW